MTLNDVQLFMTKRKKTFLTSICLDSSVNSRCYAWTATLLPDVRMSSVKPRVNSSQPPNGLGICGMKKDDIHHHGAMYHQYVHDIQLYVSTPVN